MNTFQGKTVLITGASSGIGEAAAAAFVREGAATFAVVRRPDALEHARHEHPNIRWLLGDVTKPDDLKAAVRRAVEQTGRLDALVNNAAIFDFAPLESTSETLIRSHFDINVIGLIYATQAALPALIATKGTIVNIGSVVGHKPTPGSSIYAATKAAVESLTRSWALELAPKGVRVNNVAPGPTDTPGFEKGSMPADMVPAFKAELTRQVPLGRMAQVDEVARWIVAVADPSVTWMTGAILAIDGGMSLT